jgi:hypothetical protein
MMMLLHDISYEEINKELRGASGYTEVVDGFLKNLVG